MLNTILYVMLKKKNKSKVSGFLDHQQSVVKHLFIKFVIWYVTIIQCYKLLHIFWYVFSLLPNRYLYLVPKSETNLTLIERKFKSGFSSFMLNLSFTMALWERKRIIWWRNSSLSYQIAVLFKVVFNVLTILVALAMLCH